VELLAERIDLFSPVDIHYRRSDCWILADIRGLIHCEPKGRRSAYCTVKAIVPTVPVMFPEVPVTVTV
jgi:hypothetical protein